MLLDPPGVDSQLEAIGTGERLHHAANFLRKFPISDCQLAISSGDANYQSSTFLKIGNWQSEIDNVRTPQNQAFIVGQPRICCQDWAGVLGDFAQSFRAC
jgi:hypothetical protein